MRLGLIGLRTRGLELLDALSRLPGVQVSGLCDVDAGVLSGARRRLAELGAVEASAFGDYRRLLDDPRVQGVVIATPDHWHAAMAIDACRAGKDVYLESPATHRPDEWEPLVEAARRDRRVVQTGLQQRSGDYVASAIELIRSGGLGPVHLARAWMACRRKPIGRRGDSAPPADVNYASWLGPARPRPFNSNRFHGNWSRFWDYGSGELGLWGVHWLDVAVWALDPQGPVDVHAIAGAAQSADDQETPGTLSVHYQFASPRPVEIVWEHRTWTVHGNEGRTSGIAFYGEEGTLVLDRGGWKVYDRRDARSENGSNLDRPHLANFVHCVRTREEPAASLAAAAPAEHLCCLGAAACRQNRPLRDILRREPAPPA
ncbi:MAG: Gfo/Idh/MocA family oxidoreductase [Planctomyces sp.]|nr:Gfo/Idh/MocA family oxidoreductase [Planctomyces sp.]